MRNILMINKNRFSNIFLKVFAIPAVTIAAITVFSVIPGFSGGEDADYMFVLKDGSNIMGSVESEAVLEDAAVTAIKVRTAFGEVPIPREQIVKYFKQPSKKSETPKASGDKPAVKQEAVAKPAAEDKSEKVKTEIRSETDTELKTQVESQRESTETPKSSGDKPAVKHETEAKPPVDELSELENTPGNVTAGDKHAVKQEAGAKPAAEDKKPEVKTAPETKPLPEKEVKKNETAPPVDEMSIPENTPDKVTAGDDPALISPPKPEKNADAVLNMDDDKLIDMLGESKVEAPKTPALETSTEGGTNEIDSIKAKYQYKKSTPKELIPKNLNTLTDDVKLIAASRTEEDILLGGTKEVKVKLADTTPVEVISIGDKKEKGGDGDAKKNKKKKKGAKDKKGKGGTGEVNPGTGEVSLGTGEVGLTTAEIMITDETEEVKKLGGGNLSENIVKQFKKHKAYPADSVEGKKHLEDEINKHFKKDEPKPAEETEEVKTEKKDNKK